MDYRIRKLPAKTFPALTRSFSTEESPDENGRSIPEFRSECHEKGLIEPLRALLPAEYTIFPCRGQAGECIGTA